MVSPVRRVVSSDPSFHFELWPSLTTDLVDVWFYLGAGLSAPLQSQPYGLELGWFFLTSGTAWVTTVLGPRAKGRSEAKIG